MEGSKGKRIRGIKEIEVEIGGSQISKENARGNQKEDSNIRQRQSNRHESHHMKERKERRMSIGLILRVGRRRGK